MFINLLLENYNLCDYYARILRKYRFLFVKTVTPGPILRSDEGFKVLHGKCRESLLPKNRNATICEISMQASSDSINS